MSNLKTFLTKSFSIAEKKTSDPSEYIIILILWTYLLCAEGFYLEVPDLDENIKQQEDLNEMRERRKSKKNEKKVDHVAKVIVTQFLLCAVIVGFIFALSKSGSNSFDLLKSYYEKYTQKDMSVGEIWADVKSVAKSVVKSDTSDSSSQTNSSNEIDSNSSLGMGGDDVAVYSPTSNTLFSPFMTSSTICTPVSGTISSPFGYRVNPITGIWSFHSGLDIAAGMNEKIKAAYYGTVTQTGYDGASGNYVVLSHGDGLVTKYLHCSKILVKENTVVRKGETIALVGSTGNSTGPHLHFTIEINGKKVNPLYVLESHDSQV